LTREVPFVPCSLTTERPLIWSTIILFSVNSRNTTSHCLLKWCGSYLFHRCQRVKVGQLFSSWKTLCGGMSQGSRLGPLSFIVLIDDLRAACELHKFVDVTTVSGLIPLTVSVSNMPTYFTSLLIWTANNDNVMQINTSKTKERILGSLNTSNSPTFLSSTGTVERVITFKLLGIHLDTNISWSMHINTITSKASKQVYFLKQLKRVGVPQNQLLHFYTSVIRPVLEYAAPVWHHLINRTQAQQLESIQIKISPVWD